MGWIALLLCLLFFCGPIGWGILALLLLFICLVSGSWYILLILGALSVLSIFTDIPSSLFRKKRVSHKTIKKGTEAQKTLEINNETISELVKLVGRMPEDGTPISRLNAKDITYIEWTLYKDWLQKNANGHVIVNDCTIRARSKTDKIKLINKLLKMKTGVVVQLLPEDGRWESAR